MRARSQQATPARQGSEPPSAPASQPELNKRNAVKTSEQVRDERSEAPPRAKCSAAGVRGWRLRSRKPRIWIRSLLMQTQANAVQRKRHSFVNTKIPCHSYASCCKSHTFAFAF